MQKKLTIQDIEQFFTRFNNIEGIIFNTKQKIGYDSKGNLNYSIIKDDPNSIETKPGVPFATSTADLKNKKQLISIKDNKYFIDPIVSTHGVNRHIENENLYISVPPHILESELANEVVSEFKTVVSQFLEVVSQHQGLVSQLQELVFQLQSQTTEEVEEFPSVDQISPEYDAFTTHQIFGRFHAQKIIDGICNLHKNEPLTILVLGNQVIQENVQAYGILEAERDTKFKNDSRMFKFTLPKERLRADVSPTLYYAHAEADGNLLLKSDGLDIFYNIYNETINSNKPLLIQGLDPACKVAYGFEVLRLFDKHFKSEDMFVNNESLVKAFHDLRSSVAPLAIRTQNDLAQGVYLAFCLKIIEMQKTCMQQLLQYVTKVSKPIPSKENGKENSMEIIPAEGENGTNVEDTEISPEDNASTQQNTTKESPSTLYEKVIALLQQLESPTPIKNKINAVRSLMLDKDINKHFEYTFMPNFVRGEPEIITLLKTLKTALVKREKVEEQALKIFYKEIENAHENDSAQTLKQ